MWEALLAGAVPVVLQSQAMVPFSGLPVLFVEDFRQVRKEFLEAAFEKFPGLPDIHPQMTSEFWNKKIRAAADQMEGNARMGWGEWTGESLSYGIEMLGRRFKRFA